MIALTAQVDAFNFPSTYFGWSGDFRHSFVKALFQDSPSNFIEIDSYLTDVEKKEIWHSFLSETRCTVAQSL